MDYDVELGLARTCDYESSRNRGVKTTIYLTTREDIVRVRALAASLTPVAYAYRAAVDARHPAPPPDGCVRLSDKPWEGLVAA